MKIQIETVQEALDVARNLREFLDRETVRIGHSRHGCGCGVCMAMRAMANVVDGLRPIDPTAERDAARDESAAYQVAFARLTKAYDELADRAHDALTMHEQRIAGDPPMEPEDFQDEASAVAGLRALLRVKAAGATPHVLTFGQRVAIADRMFRDAIRTARQLKLALNVSDGEQVAQVTYETACLSWVGDEAGDTDAKEIVAHYAPRETPPAKEQT